MPATMRRSATPTAAASADADPPPGVGAGDLNASSSSRTVLSTSHDDALLDDGANRAGADAHEIDRGTVDDDRVHLLADLEAADALVPVERIGAVDGPGDERFVERQAHGEAGQRHRERHRRGIAAARI